MPKLKEQAAEPVEQTEETMQEAPEPQMIEQEASLEVIWPDLEVRVMAGPQTDIDRVVATALAANEDYQGADEDAKALISFGAKLFAQTIYIPPMTCQQAKELIGWITEEEAIEQLLSGDESYLAANEADRKLMREHWEFGDDFVMRDTKNRKVRFLYSNNNREFRETHAKTFAQQFLLRQWAGPVTLPGETINGESMIVTRTGQGASLQHRIGGYILACEMWAMPGHWSHAYWPEEPVLESVLVLGVSDNPKIIETLDNTLARTEADMYYVSQLFASWTGPDGKLIGKSDKSLLSKMMAAATNFLWARVGWADFNKQEKYQTHTASKDFQERHERILKCIHHIWKLNQAPTRAISLGGKLSPGRCAATMYLMACSRSDRKKYRDGRQKDDYVSETMLDFSRWDKAADFWSQLGGQLALEHGKRSGQFFYITETLASLVDVDDGLKGRASEKDEVLALAWHKFINDEEIIRDSLKIEYFKDKNDKPHIKDPHDFGGIDVGPKEFKVRTEESKVQLDPAQQEIEDLKIATRAFNKELPEGTKLNERQQLLLRQLGTEHLKAVAAQAKADKAVKSRKPPTPKLPPAPKLKETTVNEQQTEAARKADEEAAANGNVKAKEALAKLGGKK